MRPERGIALCGFVRLRGAPACVNPEWPPTSKPTPSGSRKPGAFRPCGDWWGAKINIRSTCVEGRFGVHLCNAPNAARAMKRAECGQPGDIREGELAVQRAMCTGQATPHGKMEQQNNVR